MLDLYLLLLMYRKSYKEVQMVLSDLTLDDFERSIQGHLILMALILEMVLVGHMVTTNNVKEVR